MSPNAPSANPTSLNTNQPFGGFGQAQSDYGTAANILNYLPTQEAQSTATGVNANTNPGSILPNVSINAPVYTAATPTTVSTAPYFNASNPVASNIAGYDTAGQNAINSLNAANQGIYASALGNLSSAEQQYGNLTPVYQSLASEYNIPGYQKDIATLSGLLQNLNRDVNAQTTLGGGLMTQSARDEMYANEAQPLNTALNQAGQFLSSGQQDVSNLLGTYEKSLSNALTPLEQNINNLPTLFGQAAQAQESGISQGANTLQNLISNAQRQQEVQAQKESANAYAQQIKNEFGTGAIGTGNVINAIGGTNSGQLLPGISFKNPSQGAKGGYAFTVNNAPVSASTWAIHNSSQFGQNTAPAQAVLNMIYSMASNGDQTANQAYSEISANNGQITPSIMNKYPSLFWGTPGFVPQSSSGNNSPNTQPASLTQKEKAVTSAPALSGGNAANNLMSWFGL